MKITERVLVEVGWERERQDAKWGEQNHDLPTYLAILTEEVGEVAEAVLEHRFPGQAEKYSAVEVETARLCVVRDELVQVAAVAVAMIERVDRMLAPLVEIPPSTRQQGDDGA
jgi:NTP pyrophosphatase (non-canonical NTP hydrolase)